MITRKISRAKYNKHKEITSRSLKSDSVDVYKETLEKVSIPNYDSFDNLDRRFRQQPKVTLSVDSSRA